MKIETIAFLILTICFAIAIYLAMLSFWTLDVPMRRQTVALATSFFVAGIVLALCLVVHAVLKKVF